MPTITEELFTSVPVDLFRLGNSAGPRLDNIRPQDVDTEDVTLPSGEIVRMVHPRGGISTFDGINRRMPGKWWRIPSGTVLPDTIRVVRDQTDPRSGITHFSIRPTNTMSLLTFVAGLQALALHAQPMFTVQGGSNDAQSTGT